MRREMRVSTRAISWRSGSSPSWVEHTVLFFLRKRWQVEIYDYVSLKVIEKSWTIILFKTRAARRYARMLRCMKLVIFFKLTLRQSGMTWDDMGYPGRGRD